MDKALEKRVFLVEDDGLFASTVKGYLESQGYAVDVDERGDRAVERILGAQPGVVVLDCMLPAADGFDICRELRPKFSGVIVMLTARHEDINQMLGLGLGADSYLVKPVTPLVLLAHIKACQRRNQPAAFADRDDYRFGSFFISRTTRNVRLGAESISFSTAEFDLLWLLASRAGKVLSRDDIHTSLRQLEYDGLDRAIDMRISRLRKRLDDDPENPARIKTVRGKGYLFNPDAWG